jgi:excisionase family DNA binding protein
MADEDLLSVSAAARLLGVSPSSLRAWAAAGLVPHARTSGGHRRFDADDLFGWLAEHGGTLPAPAPPPPGTLEPDEPVVPLPDAAARVRAGLEGTLDALEDEIAERGRAGPDGWSAVRARLEEIVLAVAEGLERGDMSSVYRTTEWEGFRHGAAGRPGDVPIAGALALRRVLHAPLAPQDAPEEERRALERCLDLLPVHAATGYAEGVRARRRAAR